jgi:DNA phosphorothioation-dependent restriction protein DptH
MHKASFFEYTAAVILDFFSNADFLPGDHYQVAYEHHDEVLGQLAGLKTKASESSDVKVDKFIYKNYETLKLVYEGCDLIIATSNNVEGDFLTALRNRVVEQSISEFKGAAVLFIHNTALDSIIGGCKSLMDAGMPLNYQALRQHITATATKSISLKNYEKVILSESLNRLGVETDDSYNLFDFEAYFSILEQGTISLNDYAALHLFPDEELAYTTKDSEIKKRLQKNEEWYTEINNGAQYGSLETVLDKHFNATGVSKILKKEEKWPQTDFVDLVKWNADKNNVTIPHIIDDKGETDDKLVCWSKVEGDTAAQKKRRHIIIFNPDSKDVISYSIDFSAKLKDGTVKATCINSATVIQVVHKSILIECTIQNPNELAYTKITHKHKNYTFVFFILVVPIEHTIIEGLKPHYLIKETKKSVHLLLDTEVLNLKQGGAPLLVQDLEQGTEYPFSTNPDAFIESRESSYEFDQELKEINLVIEGFVLPARITTHANRAKEISGLDVWNLKRVQSESFRTYVSESNAGNETIIITQGTHKYYPVAAFRSNLKLEEQIIRSSALAHYQLLDGTLEKRDTIQEEDPIQQAYLSIIKYFASKDLLPSLAFIDDELANLYASYVEAFIDRLQRLEDNSAISKSDKPLLFIGTVQELVGERMLLCTPLHPLNIAYQLLVRKEVQHHSLPKYLLNKFSPANLLPFIKVDVKGRNSNYLYYQTLSQSHSPEWQYYYSDEISKHSTRDFIPRLVQEKIEQFITHFSVLFVDNKPVLKINIINQGDCQEVLQGILDYYAKFLSKSAKNGIEYALSIRVNIYGSADYSTKFEEITLWNNPNFIEKEVGVKLNVSADTVMDLLEVFNTKVSFFKLDDEQYAYSHLSFYEFDPSEVKKSHYSSDNIPTGVSLEGLLSDVPSVHEADSYRTGFGTKHISSKQNLLTSLASLYNAYATVAVTEDPFSQGVTNAFVVSKSSRSTFEKVAYSSLWVTFINPRVDLSFFKNYKDVVIIHYSDQYNNASGYDAITITSKWEPYQATILESLQAEGVEANHQDIIRIIDMFNAVNGNWLLHMHDATVTGDHSKLEKLSLLSAVKTSLSVFHHEDITWIPISLEEILRISRPIGLTQANGLFSVKNLEGQGKFTDDILLIGLEQKEHQLLMTLYPLEVKIGKNDASVERKALDQGRKTLELLNSYLVDDKSFTAKIYRNFFAKLALVGAEKYALYEVWPAYTEKWLKVAEWRKELLNDQFIISTHLHEYIGTFAVLKYTWNEEFMAGSLRYEEDACIIELLKQDALDYITESIDDLKIRFQEGKVHTIEARQLLSSKYLRHKVAIPEVFPQTTQQSVPTEVETFPLPKVEQEAVAVANSQLVFDKIHKQEILSIYEAVYSKLTAINVAIKKDIASEINFLEGPAFYKLEVRPQPSTTFKKIVNAGQELNIALKLNSGQQVRVFQDKGKVWVEVPKQDHQKVVVTTAHVWDGFSKSDDFEIPFGMDVDGKVININFSSSNSPHLLLAGTTGSGKSVVLDTLIRGAAELYEPTELNMFLIDPKGNELIDFEGLPHVPQPNGTTSADAIALLERCVQEMDARYLAFVDRELRATHNRAAKDIVQYNQMVADSGKTIPRWLVVLDEYSDLLDEDPSNKPIIETLLRRLAQKARAAGIHVILATQKPLATIVSSVIRANLPAVIALKVRTAGDSRVILDDSGAETLAGRGDSLFKNGAGDLVRVQCAIHLH